MNKVMLEGNLGHDVTEEDVRETQQGVPVINFRICTNTYYKGQDGTTKSRPEWHRITMFGNRSANEKILRRLKKGALLFVEGELRTTSWEDQDGIKCYTTEVRVGHDANCFRIVKDAQPRPEAADSDGDQDVF